MTALFSSSVPNNVIFTFRVDGIAQEYSETLILELVPTTTLPANAFFRKYLALTIVDNDSMFTLPKNSRYSYIFISYLQLFQFHFRMMTTKQVNPVEEYQLLW